MMGGCVTYVIVMSHNITRILYLMNLGAGGKTPNMAN